MFLTPGTRLGPYEILSPLGAGGMGEVYRARDTKLNRDVALKILPEAFATDPERLSRFRREAQVLASLNHPNIGHIYGVEDSGASHALVLELVEGPTLADRIANGPLPLDDVLPIARQTANALEAAHAHGIIHRDLKPANIKVRDDGAIKVLDFGLAKVFEPTSVSGADPAYSPTLTHRATELGVILGTAAYMAPEQAKGQVVDTRADIWAFGVVLYEMLTGRRPFTGDTASEMVAAVIKDQPDWSHLPADLPAQLRGLLRRCLQKEPAKRLRDIGDARLDLDDIGDTASTLIATSGQRPARVSWLALFASAAVGIAVTAFVMSYLLRPSLPAGQTRLSVVAPESAALFPDSREFAISPDGKIVAFVTGSIPTIEASQLWVRPLDAPNARLIQGATGAHLPFWSPDGQRIGFFADGKLRTVGVDGGRVAVVCNAPDGRGGTWSSGGVIVFAPSNAGPLLKVAVSGGEPLPATSLDEARKETGHRFPFFLPDGKHFLFVALPARNGQFDVFVGALDSTARSLLLSADSAPVYTEPGYLLFARNGVVVARAFDATRLRLFGDAIALDDAPGDIGNWWRAGSAVSATAGALVYLNDPFVETRLAWVDREGRETGAVDATPARYTEIKLSPDGQRAALVRAASPTVSSIWVLDLVRLGATRIADAPHFNFHIAWAPDGKRLAYTNNGSGTENLFVRDAAGATPEESLYVSADLFKKPQSWSPDGRSVLFTQLSPETQNDLLTVSATGDHQATPYLNSPFNEDVGRFSPDGRWVAYVSDEAGSNDVYVRSFPVPDRKYRATTDGGKWVWWKQDGAALMILGVDSRQLKVADVRNGAELSIGTPKVVGALPVGTIAYDAARDLQHLLVSLPKSGNGGLSLMVVTDWQSALVKR